MNLDLLARILRAIADEIGPAGAKAKRMPMPDDPPPNNPPAGGGGD
jgi:hypothetical protein